VRVFGTNKSDLEALASWLVACGIETVAGEPPAIRELRA
jgi:hypothetical protein